MVDLRTYLCPNCDGYGAFADAYGAPAGSCPECLGSGVVERSYAEGDRRNLQPWTGDEGRNVRRPCHRLEQRVDPLLTLAKHRNAKDRASGAYALRLARAMRPRLAQLRMIEAAIQCDLACQQAVQAFRRAVA